MSAMAHPENIYPTFDRMMDRDSKEALLGQKGIVIWMYGLSASGKSTLANLLERRLHEDGKLVKVLDGDNVRVGLNNDLGFTNADRDENIRRASETAKLFLELGVVTIVSFISPTKAHRELAKSIVGGVDFFEVYIKAPLKECAARDPKGLYGRVSEGRVADFTGIESPFEESISDADLVIETAHQTEAESLKILLDAVKARLLS